jgi:hypothetical protein
MESAMKRIKKKLDLILLTFLMTVLVGPPFGIQGYDSAIDYGKKALVKKTRTPLSASIRSAKVRTPG